jgi:hypothetical protein
MTDNIPSSEIVAISGSEQGVSSDGGSPLLYTFNKYFADMVMGLKKANPIVKASLTHYKVMENLSTLRENMDHFTQNVVESPSVMAVLENADITLDDILNDVAVLESYPVKGVNMLTVKTASASDGGAALWGTLRYVYVLLVLHAIHKEQKQHSQLSDDQKNERLQHVLRIFGKIQAAVYDTAADSDEKREQMVDDALAETADNCSSEKHLVHLFRKYSECEAKVAQSVRRKNSSSSKTGAGGEGKEDFESMFGNSKIGGLVKELMSEFNPDELNMDESLFDSQNPLEALSNFQNMMNSSSGVGSMLSRMGQKMQSKIGSGELRLDELIGETMGLIGNNAALQNNPIIANLLSMMNNGGGGGNGGGMQADILKNLFSKMGSGGGGNEGEDGQDEQNMADMFSKLDSMMKGGGGKAAAAAAASSSSQHHASSGTRDRLRKKHESKYGSGGQQQKK